jgi:surface polysaccharide O-acyltransferase-like enzyme
MDVELMRVVAMVMVVTIHATSTSVQVGERTSAGVAYWVGLVANEASRCAVPVFFAISGWALLRRSGPWDVAWLWQRVTRLGVPLLVWSALFLLEEVVRSAIAGTTAWASKGDPGAWLTARLVQVADGHGDRAHLWYLYVAIAIAVVVWLIAGARQRRQQAVPYLVASLAIIVPVGLVEALGSTARWADIAWSLGYTALGFALLDQLPRRLVGGALYVTGVGLMVALTALLGYDTWPTAYPSPFVVMATVGTIWLIEGVSVPGRWKAAVLTLGSLSLGVYLVHPMMLDVMRTLMLPGWPLAGLSPLPRLVVLWGFGIVASIAVTLAWHRSPRLVRLLG